MTMKHTSDLKRLQEYIDCKSTEMEAEDKSKVN